MPGVLHRLDAARAEGLRITIEVYPYTATSTKLRTFIPKETLQGGVDGMGATLQTVAGRRQSIDWLRARATDFDAMLLITESLPGAAGQSIQHVAARHGRDPADMVVDLLLQDPDAWIIYRCMAQADVDAAVCWNDAIICSDSWSYPVNAPRQIGHPHPRTYGAFTRFLERYALNDGPIPFGQAVRKITSYPAQWLELTGRGRIAEGYYADLVVLNPAEVREKATFRNPRQFSEGTVYVWVNGTLMLERGTLYQKRPGHVLRFKR